MKIKKTTRKIGIEGEKSAKDYLAQNHYTIITTNYYSKFGEIDIIAQKESCLVFIEVKHYKPNSMIHPLYKITKKKQSNLTKTAKTYILHHPSTTLDYQFDIILVENECVTDHIKHAF